METNYDVNVFKSKYFNVLDTIGCCSLYGYPTLSFTDDKLKYHCMYHFNGSIYIEIYNDNEEEYNFIKDYWDNWEDVINDALSNYIYDKDLEECACCSRMNEDNRVDYNDLVEVYKIIIDHMENISVLAKLRHT